ncbi:MAG: STAS domain-containing protein [Cyanobacteriota bacterium]
MLHIEYTTHTTSNGTCFVVFQPIGRLDIKTAWQFRMKLQEGVSRISPHLVVDLSQVISIDSSGLTALVAGMRETQKVNGSFCVCQIHPEAKLVFEVTEMDNVFQICSDCSDCFEDPVERGSVPTPGGSDPFLTDIESI